MNVKYEYFKLRAFLFACLLSLICQSVSEQCLSHDHRPPQVISVLEIRVPAWNQGPEHQTCHLVHGFDLLLADQFRICLEHILPAGKIQPENKVMTSFFLNSSMECLSSQGTNHSTMKDQLNVVLVQAYITVMLSFFDKQCDY